MSLLSLTPLESLPFDAGARGYCSTNARLCVAASAQTYLANPSIDSLETSTEVLVTDREDCLLVAFKGSREIKDWIINAQFLRVKYGAFGFGMVEFHSGFFDAVNSVIDQVVARIQNAQLNDPLKPVVLTGHSLGGADAVLCAHLLKLHGVPIHSIYTFGQPRVGNAVAARQYAALGLADRTFRIVNEEDVVPRIPGVLLGFRHTGQLMFFSSFSSLLGVGKIMARPSLWFMALSDLLGIFQDWKQGRLLALLDDHHIENYEALAL